MVCNYFYQILTRQNFSIYPILDGKLQAFYRVFENAM
jgi:hypothetical protein